MPKLIDNYVLCRKIGAGQFGEVLKGYDRTSNIDIAVKVIKRENLKGKFVELLENEIKVLQSCDNNNIIKLYDLKKTPNNFYLVLEYCNEGDLHAYVKKKKHLTEDEAVEFLVQILHGFRTLVKNKILHRDFKLANILLHDGEIKIADFGFSKLLSEDEFARTVLGSPLNMAPEVIAGALYNSKADIYSIGVCFYEMLFGKPPFNAPNIIELSKVIKKNNIQFPRSVNKISPLAESLIKSMLNPDPEKRIDWPELFDHPITKSEEENMQKLLTTTLGSGGNPLSNMSKFYIKQNMVILHPNEILKKEDINNFAFDAVKNNRKQLEYKGELIKRQVATKPVKNTFKREETTNTEGLEDKESKAEYLMRKFKSNTRFLLNERNKLIFIVSIMNEVEDRIGRKYAKEVLKLIDDDLMKRVEVFVQAVRERQNMYDLDCWDEYLKNNEFEIVSKYFTKEYDIVCYEHEEAQHLAGAVKPMSLNNTFKSYMNDIIDQLKLNKPYEEVNRVNWIHVDHLVDFLNVDNVMKSAVQDEFNFKLYYLENGKITMQELVEKVIKKAKI